MDWVDLVLAVVVLLGIVSLVTTILVRRAEHDRGVEIRVDGRQIRLAEGASDRDILATIRRLRGERP